MFRAHVLIIIRSKLHYTYRCVCVCVCGVCEGVCVVCMCVCVVCVCVWCACVCVCDRDSRTGCNSSDKLFHDFQ